MHLLCGGKAERAVTVWAEWWHRFNPTVGQLQKAAGRPHPSGKLSERSRDLLWLCPCPVFTAAVVREEMHFLWLQIQAAWRRRRWSGPSAALPVPCNGSPSFLLSLQHLSSLSVLLAKKHKYMIFFIVESLLSRKRLNNKINENNILINQIR